MASTYTAAGIELIADGEQSGTWGQTTNTNFELFEEMITGVVSIALSSSTYTLATSDGASSEGRHAIVVFTGTPGGTCTVTVSPNDMQKVYTIKNSSDQTVTLTQGSGGNVSITAGSIKTVYCDGAGAGAEVVDISGTATLTSLGVTASAAELNTLDGITSTVGELNLVDGSVAGTVVNSKAVIYGASGEVNATTLQIGGSSITATAAELNTMDGITATVGELNQLDGVTLSNYADRTADAAWTGSQRATVVTDNDGSFDMNAGQNFSCTPTGSITLTFTNIANGQSGFILLVNTTPQTVSLHANTKGDANLATTLSTAGTYLCSYFSNGTNVYVTTSAAIA